MAVAEPETGAVAPAGAAWLAARGLTKRYGGLAAVDDLSFEVTAGEVSGIAGPNGAGKTTLFDVVSGLVPPTAGEVLLDGEPLHAGPQGVCHAGVARTFQIPASFPTQTAFGNVLAAAYFGRSRRAWPGIRFGGDAVERARAALAFVGLEKRAGALAGPLSVFDKKRLMVASAVATEPRVLLLDEPVGGLNAAEMDAVIALVQRIRAAGVTVVVIEHVMRALMRLSDRIMVMNHGRKLYEGSPADVMSDAEVVRTYLGTARRGEGD
jgi:branched-chain amino acid transport system ATP-binding protein